MALALLVFLIPPMVAGAAWSVVLPLPGTAGYRLYPSAVLLHEFPGRTSLPLGPSRSALAWPLARASQTVEGRR